jgi:hypothetical protein
MDLYKLMGVKEKYAAFKKAVVFSLQNYQGKII